MIAMKPRTATKDMLDIRISVAPRKALNPTRTRMRSEARSKQRGSIQNKSCETSLPLACKSM
jgi:hypothetical protein